MRFFITSLLPVMFLAYSSQAWATYSIVATDRTSRQVGGATTSCVQGSSVSLVYEAAPGIGAVHAQAYSNREARAAAVQLLNQGYSAAETLQAITSTRYDQYAAYRQYGIVSFDETVAYTGSNNGEFAGDLQGRSESYRYTIQGNILTSEQVLLQSEAAFIAGGCDLADKLMLALEAGAANGEGDQRCRPMAPADAAFIQVDNADGSAYLRLDIRASRQPLRELRQRFDQWRRQNPCQS
ncbi:MAG: DUF1028 domain-containing protein [Oligoflexus sp.]